jgi:hypothetical protein
MRRFIAVTFTTALQAFLRSENNVSKTAMSAYPSKSFSDKTGSDTPMRSWAVRRIVCMRSIPATSRRNVVKFFSTWCVGAA